MATIDGENIKRKPFNLDALGDIEDMPFKSASKPPNLKLSDSVIKTENSFTRHNAVLSPTPKYGTNQWSSAKKTPALHFEIPGNSLNAKIRMEDQFKTPQRTTIARPLHAQLETKIVEHSRAATELA